MDPHAVERSTPPNEHPRPPLRHRLEMVGVNVAGGLLRVLPLRLAVKLLGGLGTLAAVVFRVRRKTVDRNLRLAFPNETSAKRRAIAHGAYRHLAAQSGVLIRMAFDDQTLDHVLSHVGMADDGTPEIARWMKDRHHNGEGTLLLMGHFGNWEIGAATMSRSVAPIVAVATRQSNDQVDERIQHMRRRHKLGVIPRNEAKTAVPRALSAGSTVLLAADQFTWDGVPIRFFGHPTLGARGPAVFARRAKVPVVFLSLLAAPDDPISYTLHLSRIEVPEQSSVRLGTAALTQAYFDHLERAIRDHPEQYLWHHRRWRPLEDKVDAETLERLSGDV